MGDGQQLVLPIQMRVINQLLKVCFFWSVSVFCLILDVHELHVQFYFIISIDFDAPGNVLNKYRSLLLATLPKHLQEK